MNFSGNYARINKLTIGDALVSSEMKWVALDIPFVYLGIITVESLDLARGEIFTRFP